MAEILNIRIRGRDGFEIDTDLYFPRNNKDKDASFLIFAHGFKGFKNWGGFPYMLSKLADSGFVCVGFNFTFNGVSSDNPTEFTRLDLFAQNTFSRELNDLESVIDYFYTHSDKYSFDKNRIGLIGHSRGGGISIIKAGENENVKCLVTLAAVSDFNRYTDEHKKLWRKQGYFETLNTRTNQLMRLNSASLDDIENNKSRLDIGSAVRKLKIPFLIIHGKEDLSVRFTEAEDLYHNSDKKYTELYPVENTGHTFGVVHPFAGTTKAFENVIEKISEFAKKNL